MTPSHPNAQRAAALLSLPRLSAPARAELRELRGYDADDFAEGITRAAVAVKRRASLRGAGWRPVANIVGAQWTRRNRPRELQAVFEADKIRWEA